MAPRAPGGAADEPAGSLHAADGGSAVHPMGGAGDGGGVPGASEGAPTSGSRPAGSEDPESEFFGRFHDPSWSSQDLSPSRNRSRDPAPTPESRRARQLFWTAWGGAVGILVIALVLHYLPLALPGGLETHLVLVAALAILGAAKLWKRAAFSPRLADKVGEEAELAAHRARLWLMGLGIALGVQVALLGFLEIMALFVGLKLWAIRDSSSVLFVSNYVVFMAIVLGVQLAALYARTRIPSTEEEVPRLEFLERILTPVLLVVAGLAAFFALGIPFVNGPTGIASRQAMYIASLALIPLAVLVNLKLRIPHAVAIIRREIEESKSVTRKNADVMRRRVLRNYVMVLLFIAASIVFLVVNATGLVKVGSGAGGDVLLAVYISMGLIFLAVAAIAFFQTRNFTQRVGPRHAAPGIIPERKRTKEELNRIVLLSLSVSLAGIFFLAGLAVLTGLLSTIGGTTIDKDVSTDLFVAAFLGGVGPYGYFYVREANRIRAIDEKFPDFLRDLAESQRAGMTLPRALVTAAKGTYGALSVDIRKMAAQVEWGVPFTSALQRFAKRCRTPLIERTVSLIVEASNSGGNVVDVLGAASEDAREIKNILWERKSQMGVYSLIIYIAFFVFIAVVAILNAQFIPQLAAATGSVAGASVGGLTFGEIDVAGYQRLFFHASLIQGIGGGLVSGVMTEGHPMAGLKHAFIMVVIGYVLFRFLII